MIEEEGENKVEALETVTLVEDEITQTMKIRMTLSPEIEPGPSSSLKRA